MEESSNKQPPRCPCGFWGSTQTLGLCSKCFCEAQGSQNQGNILSSDSGKPSVGGHCHNQLRGSRNNQGVGPRMDSKHFPSHSTTDNLPSSLSSPGERPASLAAAQAPVPHSSSVESSCATSTTNTSTLLSPANMGAVTSTAAACDNAEKKASDTDSSRSSPNHLMAVPSGSETSVSSASTDQSYEPGCAQDNCSTASHLSVVSSSASSITVSYPSSSPSASSSSLPSQDSPALRGSTDPTNSQGAVHPSDSGKSSQQDVIAQAKKGLNATTLVDISGAEPNSSTCLSSSNKDKSVLPVRKAEGEERISVSSAAQSSSSSPLPDQKSKEWKAASEESPSKRGLKRTRDDMESSAPSEASASPSPQKNRKRCFTCSCKLELAQRTIGRCRCERIFCAMHRLPELHDCEFNHKEDGRREAREKMVVPTRHLGPSFRREDHS